MSPFLTWIHAELPYFFPATTAIPLLEVENYITVRRKRLILQMVPKKTLVTTRGAPKITMIVPQRTQKMQGNNKDITPEELWEIQQIALSRMFNIQAIKDLPKIRNNMALLKKKKDQTALEIACLRQARAIYLKSSHINQTVVAILLRSAFHAESPR